MVRMNTDLQEYIFDAMVHYSSLGITALSQDSDTKAEILQTPTAFLSTVLILSHFDFHRILKFEDVLDFSKRQSDFMITVLGGIDRRSGITLSKKYRNERDILEGLFHETLTEAGDIYHFGPDFPITDQQKSVVTDVVKGDLSIDNDDIEDHPEFELVSFITSYLDYINSYNEASIESIYLKKISVDNVSSFIFWLLAIRQDLPHRLSLVANR